MWCINIIEWCCMKCINLIGKKFGKLIVSKRLPNNKRSEAVWLCVCDCGRTKIVKTNNLTSGKITHCGCSKRCKRNDSIIGKKFHRLLVVSFSHYSGRTSVYNCVCECGNKNKSTKNALTTGRTKSYGCYIKEICGLRMYNPDVPDEIRQIWRTGEQYKKWVKNIRNKYDNKCDICGNSKMLVAHHLVNWLSHPELRFDINNGICLCRQCHYNFHSKYGLNRNTPAQYWEFRKVYGYE